MEEVNPFKKYRIKHYTQHTKQVYCLAWNCNGKYLASSDNQIKIWKYKKGLALTFDKDIRAHTDQIQSMQFNPNERQKYLLCSCSKNSVKLWDTREPNKSQFSIKTRTHNTYLAWSPDGSVVSVGNKDNVITIYQAEDFKPKQELKIKEGVLQESMWDPKEGNVLFVAVNINDIGYVQVYDGKNPTDILYQLECHRAPITSMVSDSQGLYFATGGKDALVAIWNLYEMICIKTYSGLTEDIQKLDFSKDSKYIANVSQNDYLDIINTETGTLVHRIDENKDRRDDREQIPQILGGQNTIKWHPTENEFVYVTARDKQREKDKKDNYSISLFYQQ